MSRSSGGFRAGIGLSLGAATVMVVFSVAFGSRGAIAAPQETSEDLFATHDRCFACHNGLVDADGNDVSIAPSWRGSMMANSARDPYWQASVRGEVMDHPELQAAIEDKCATCHMPMARFAVAVEGGAGTIFTNLEAAGLAPEGALQARPSDRLAELAADGVSCTLCHQIEPEGLGEPESFSGAFVIDTTRRESRTIVGPKEVDAGLVALMHSATGFEPAKGTHLSESELCASCHTLYTHYVDRSGEPAGELPEQVPYLEWLHSEYRDSRSCQDCHMPGAEGPVRISSVLGEPRESLARHVFRGGNAYMLGVLRRYRDELGVTATDAELEASIVETRTNLRERTASLRLEEPTLAEGRLRFEVEVENLTGHKLPTAYPSRRAWLHVTVRDADGRLVFESGAPREDGSIDGNDNDADPALYEPHHERIEGPEQVQIYEPMMVDTEGEVTTGLLFGARYVKDNRILPHGFDKTTAPEDVAVQGNAAGDENFVGGTDRVVYEVPVEGARAPFAVEAELLYQSVSFRWARNLSRHEAPEIDRFLGYWDATGGESPEPLARARIVLPSIGGAR